MSIHGWGICVASSHLQTLCLLLFFDFLTELSVDDVAVLLLLLPDVLLEDLGKVSHQAETRQSDWRPTVVVQDPLGIQLVEQDISAPIRGADFAS